MSTDPGGGQAHPPGRQAPLRVSCRPCLGTLTRTHDFWGQQSEKRRNSFYSMEMLPFATPSGHLGDKHLSKEGQWEGEEGGLPVVAVKVTGWGEGDVGMGPSFPSHRLRENRAPTACCSVHPNTSSSWQRGLAPEEAA